MTTPNPSPRTDAELDYRAKEYCMERAAPPQYAYTSRDISEARRLAFIDGVLSERAKLSRLSEDEEKAVKSASCKYKGPSFEGRMQISYSQASYEDGARFMASLKNAKIAELKDGFEAQSVLNKVLAEKVISANARIEELEEKLKEQGK